MLALFDADAVGFLGFAGRKFDMHASLRIEHDAARFSPRSGESRRQGERAGKHESAQSIRLRKQAFPAEE
jgi:hypothetical protein